MEASFLALPLDDLVAEYIRAFSLADHASAPIELARALAISPPILRSNALIAVKVTPATVAIVVGPQDEQLPVFRSMPGQVANSLKRLRYVDWAAVEQAVESLADRLRSELGRTFVEQARFRGIPRGGQVVLGLLSYALGLRADQINSDSDQEPVVIVDDCALSGLRFKETIAALKSTQVVFAPLFSHPALRVAITNSEARAIACISGADLMDYTERMPALERSEWNRWWTEKTHIYWTGQPDHLVFPWSETELGLWNPVTEQVTPGWYVAPPSLCMHHRAVGYDERDVKRLQIVNPGNGTVRLADSVLYVVIDDDVALFDLSREQTWGLSGVAAAMWRAVLERASLADAAEEIAATYRIDGVTALSDIHQFVEELGLLGLVTHDAPL